jgi:hypothetical protein
MSQQLLAAVVVPSLEGTVPHPTTNARMGAAVPCQVPAEPRGSEFQGMGGHAPGRSSMGSAGARAKEKPATWRRA